MDETPKAPTPVTLGILDRLLAYMDRPWKVVSIAALLILGGIGWVLYEERAEIANAILHEPFTRPVLDVAKFKKGAEKLLRDTKSDVTVLAELDLNENLAVDRVGIDRDGNFWVPIEGPQPALYPDTDMTAVIRFLHNEVVCGDTKGRASADLQALAAAGYPRACFVAVPPVLGTSVGALLVAWRVALSLPAEQRAGIVLTTAAMTFANW